LEDIDESRAQQAHPGVSGFTCERKERERAPKVDKPPIKPNKRKRKKYRAKKKRVESEEELVASETEEP
jgi:hypothetical protein